MPTNKRKTQKMRGSKTHGYGSKKKHRGAGSRGGRGRAGLFKHKRSWTIKHEPWILKPKHDFAPPKDSRNILKTINLIDLEKLASGKKEINLSEFGFSKLLGNGKIKRALSVTVEQISKKAKEKIEKAGGKVVSITQETAEESE